MTASAPRKRQAARAYHHGNLRQAMIDAAIAMVEQGGAESVTIREAARRANVSSGAPFRHFPNKAALMTAVAEEGMAHLRANIERCLRGCRSDHPLARLFAMGEGYFAWALGNPTYYRVVGDRTQIAFWGSEALTRDNQWIRSEMKALFVRARDEDLLRDCDLSLVHLQSRALVYGLARMHVDGHLSEFGITKARAPATARAVLREWLLGIARDPGGLRKVLDEG